MRQFVLVMGILSGIFGSSASADEFHSEKEFEANLAQQLAMTPQTMSQLRKYGVTDDSELRLEYFFYTNEQDKARKLNEELLKLGYEGHYGPSASDSAIFIITGWTDTIRMTDESVLSWTESMCRIGYENDAEFDGWGTNPNPR